MSAYDYLLDASFKGVSFFVDSEELPRFGRRIAQHEYPHTDEQYAEDVGGFPQDFTINGYVVGENSKEQITALISACKNHPQKQRHQYFK